MKTQTYLIDDFFSLFCTGKSLLIFLGGTFYAVRLSTFRRMANARFMMLGCEWEKDGKIVKLVSKGT